VHVLAAGVDGFPLGAVGDRAITCSRGASAPAIAEFVIASMLAFEKQFPATWLSEPPARWNIASLGTLRGRTLGLVGIGAIGAEVARLARALGMDVQALRRRTGAPLPIEGVSAAASLPEVLDGADHVVVTAPATAATRHLIDAAACDAMKPGVHFVNIARGSLVDQTALLAALDAGHIALASLDVVEPEPLPDGHPLFAHPRVHLSAHVSWSSPETMTRTIDLFTENLHRWRTGQPLVGTVDIAAGY
jgi:phosphoglycerate dehydrogenase-like enzyme